MGYSQESSIRDATNKIGSELGQGVGCQEQSRGGAIRNSGSESREGVTRRGVKESRKGVTGKSGSVSRVG